MVSEQQRLWANILGKARLNPCCGGIWSRSIMYHCYYIILTVLILVVVEYGLGEITWCI